MRQSDGSAIKAVANGAATKFRKSLVIKPYSAFDGATQSRRAGIGPAALALFEFPPDCQLAAAVDLAWSWLSLL